MTYYFCGQTLPSCSARGIRCTDQSYHNNPERISFPSSTGLRIYKRTLRYLSVFYSQSIRHVLHRSQSRLREWMWEVMMDII